MIPCDLGGQLLAQDLMWGGVHGVEQGPANKGENSNKLTQAMFATCNDTVISGVIPDHT